MDRYALFKDYIVTAREDGSIPLNAKVVCNTYGSGGDSAELAKLIAQANLAAALVEVLEGIGLAEQPGIKAARVKAAREMF